MERNRAKAELIKHRAKLVAKHQTFNDLMAKLPTISEAIQTFEAEDPCATEQAIYNAAATLSDALHNVAVAANELASAAAFADQAGDALEAAALSVLTTCRNQSPP